MTSTVLLILGVLLVIFSILFFVASILSFLGVGVWVGKTGFAFDIPKSFMFPGAIIAIGLMIVGIFLIR